MYFFHVLESAYRMESDLFLAILVQEWPEEDYPPYANGPGYILSSDVAHFIVSEFEKHKLRVSSLHPTSFVRSHV